MEENSVKTYPLTYKSASHPFGWFGQMHAYVSRFMSFMYKSKAVKAGQAKFLMMYGGQHRDITADGYQVNALTMTFCMDRTAKVMMEGKTTVLTPENMCYLFGYYTRCVEKDGSPKYDDSGNEVVIWNWEGLQNYLRNHFQPFKPLVLVTMVPHEDIEFCVEHEFVS